MATIGEEDARRREEAERAETRARTVACACCKAAVGAPCVTLPGRVAGRDTKGGRPRSYHTNRVIAAFRAERAREAAAKVTP